MIPSEDERTSARRDPTSWERAAPSQDNPEPIPVAVVGVGYWGRNLIRNLSGSPNFHIVWLVDESRSSGADKLATRVGARFSTDLQSVLADDTLKAVVIATPADTHETIAMAALCAGLHVLAEKPLATSVEAARLLTKEAASRNLQLMVDHTYCYSAPVANLSELITHGALGDVEYITATRANLGTFRNDVDVVWDLAPHDFSIVDSLLPRSTRVATIQAVGALPLDYRCSVAQLSLQLTTGGFVSLHVSWRAPEKVRRMVVGGTKLTAIWDDCDSASALQVFDSFSGEPHYWMQGAARSTSDLEPLRAVVDAFAESIRTGVPPTTDGRSALRVMELLEGASESLRNGGDKVELAYED